MARSVCPLKTKPKDQLLHIYAGETAKFPPGVGAHACKPSTWEVEGKEPEFSVILGQKGVQGQPQLHETLPQ